MNACLNYSSIAINESFFSDFSYFYKTGIVGTHWMLLKMLPMRTHRVCTGLKST